MNVFATDLAVAAKTLEMHPKSGSLEHAVELLDGIRREVKRVTEYKFG